MEFPAKVVKILRIKISRKLLTQPKIKKIFNFKSYICITETQRPTTIFFSE